MCGYPPDAKFAIEIHMKKHHALGISYIINVNIVVPPLMKSVSLRYIWTNIIVIKCLTSWLWPLWVPPWHEKLALRYTWRSLMVMHYFISWMWTLWITNWTISTLQIHMKKHLGHPVLYNMFVTVVSDPRTSTLY